MPITAIAFNCTLKSAKGGETSSTEALLLQLIDQLRIRCRNRSDPRRGPGPGTGHNMGQGDGWPALREKLLAAEIVVIATPI